MSLATDAKDDSGLSATGRLSDVHEGLPPPGIVGGSVHLISGSYDYHHYMQVVHGRLLMYTDSVLPTLIVTPQVLCTELALTCCFTNRCRTNLTTKAGAAPTAHCRPSAPGSGGSTTPRLSRPATVPSRLLSSGSVWLAMTSLYMHQMPDHDIWICCRRLVEIPCLKFLLNSCRGQRACVHWQQAVGWRN